MAKSKEESDNREVVKNNSKGLKEPSRRNALDTWIAESLLGGYRQRDLPALYKQKFDNKISRSQISLSIRRLTEEWKLTRIDDTALHIGRELERLDEMEHLAWKNYRSCGGTIQTTEVKDLFGHTANSKGEMVKKESLITTKTKEDPRLAMQWFDRIMKIQTDRRKVLKLEATVNIQNIMALKGYSIFDPGKDWPEQKHLPDPNVIDAEFEEKRQVSK